MDRRSQYHIAESLEQSLGDPYNPESVMSFAKVIAIDESEIFPQTEIDWLYDWGLHNYYVPAEYGGKFTCFEELVAIIRVLARRDQTIAIAMTTLFWSFLTWIGGTTAQKTKLAQEITQQKGTMCLGYSEKEHGSDLIGGDLHATKVSGGYLFNGEKWPINRATRSTVSYILAKTNSEATPKSLSLFQIHKNEISPDNYYNLPKILTHGIRASDMSGIGFKDCFIPETHLLQQEGDGLELALKGFQITRTLCAAFSHGAADTALRTTLNFALNRQIYQKKVIDLPQPRQTLTDAFLDILICECETIPSARGFHIIPQQFSVWSAVVKYFVTTRLETMINNVSVVLGSRFYFREEHDWGIFQKLLRDNSIISMFDGSSVVNLHALILQLRQLTKYRDRRQPETYDQISSSLAEIFSLDKPLPTFDGTKLSLFGRGIDYPLQGLEIAQTTLRNLTTVNPTVINHLQDLTQIILTELDNHDQTITQSQFAFGHEQSPETFAIAQKYCTLHAACCCLHFWLYNRDRLGEFFAEGEWLVLSLHRLLRTIRPMAYYLDQVYVENITQYMLKLYQENRQFSLIPIQLANEDEINATPRLQLQN
ncbi:MAG: acyl-CoA dehydrogenase [Gloeocapsa sp. DLM2.Bin57]|nr:MAG: acyl-CoA dehydrogenase [Gloeocapsa sp. DLM2.Bin57]